MKLVSKSGVGKKSVFYQAAEHFLGYNDFGVTRKLFLRWKRNVEGVQDIFTSLVATKSRPGMKPSNLSRNLCSSGVTSEDSLIKALQKLGVCIQHPSEVNVSRKPLWPRLCKELGCADSDKNRLRANRVWNQFVGKPICTSSPS